MHKNNQKGSVVTYLVVALFLMGLLIAAMTQGAKKHASSAQLDEMVIQLAGDINLIHNAISECAQTHSGLVDIDANGIINAADNPNPPFPLYNDLSNGGTGDLLADIKCPAAPAAQQVIFVGNLGEKFKLLGDTSTYTTTYFNDSTEGVYLRITRATGDPVWAETISRVNSKYSACSAAPVTAAGTCANGCFYYWALRRATSVLGGEVGCP